MSRLLGPTLAALVLVASACGGDDDAADTTTTDATTTTTTTTTTDTTSSEPDPTASWQHCESPEGYGVSYPEGWSTNDGGVVGECSQFDPEPFTVPAGTDERVAAITAYVDPVPFHEAAAPGDETDRAVTSVDGHQAVRLVEAGSEFYGEDVGATRYIVDLASEVDEDPQTLFVDTVDLTGMDYDENVEVLDRMVRSIELGDTDDTQRTVVARYGGGGTPFSAAAELRGDEACITVPLEGEPSTTCFSAPGPESIRVADLSGELLSVLGGVAGGDVFRVDAEIESGTFSFLPVEIGGSSVRAWAMPVDPAEVSTVTFSRIDGVELGSRTPDHGA